MKNLEDHPIAAIFPLMSSVEFKELVEDIKKQGLKDEICLFEDKILDGRNRYRACVTAKMPVKTHTFCGTFLEAIHYVWSKNFVRRHLNPSQSAVADAKRQKMLNVYAPVKEAAQEREKSGKGIDGSGGRGKKRNPTQQIGEGLDHHKRETADIRARIAGTNRTYINFADKLVAERPDLVKQVESGEKTLTEIQRAGREERREEKRKGNAAKVADVKVITEAVTGVFSTIVIDPPWDWGDEGDVNQLGRAKPDYATLSFEELKKLPVGKLSDDDCHLYLWITNRSLPKGFELIEKWGFRYVTCITWCKPSFGMGNYFRGSTEHILFAVKGSLSLKRKNAGTWFAADRPRGHSVKPDEAYALVESCSPGPYLDMFGRKERDGWKQWGENSL
jgi:N6-adenosine-specific RNA methylase IME4